MIRFFELIYLTIYILFIPYLISLNSEILKRGMLCMYKFKVCLYYDFTLTFGYKINLETYWN